MSSIVASYSLTDIANNPNIGIEIGKEIEAMSWTKSPFEPLVGTGSDRGIRSYQIANKQPFRPRLKARLTGSGVQDNEEFKTNYDEMEILNQTVFPKISGNGLLSPVFHYSEMQMIDFDKESRDSLATWMMDTRDKQFIAALTNDLTNCVVADATNGYKDTTNETSVVNATKKIVAGDVITVKAIRKAIFMARAGLDYKGREVFPLKPIRAQSFSQGGISVMHYSYIIMLDSYGIQQLRNDEEWRDMQKYAGERGDKNNLFMGLVGMIDGCPVLDFGIWSEAQAGLLNSEVKDEEFLRFLNKDNANGKIVKPSQYADAQPVSVGFLIGASALIIAGSLQPRVYTEQVDAGRKIAVGMDRVMAIAKARFGEDDKGVHKFKGKDFATIGIFYSKE